ncbi:MAG TPA: hypothetical protein VKY85_25135 [Candidatus Angelobacter sp.]|nr:hypothetical protein [Candidatus Angelobacter sp.]
MVALSAGTAGLLDASSAKHKHRRVQDFVVGIGAILRQWGAEEQHV